MLNQNINFTSSIIYITLWLLLTLLALGVVIIIPIYFICKLLLIIAISCYGWQVLYQYGLLQHANSITAITITADGDYHFYTPTTHFYGSVTAESVVSRFIMVLYIQDIFAIRHHIMIILPDMLDTKAYKALTMALRFPIHHKAI